VVVDDMDVDFLDVVLAVDTKVALNFNFRQKHETKTNY